MQLRILQRENIDEIIEKFIPERKRHSPVYLEKAINFFLKMKTKYRKATKKELLKYYVAFPRSVLKKDLELLSDNKLCYYKKRRKPISLEDNLKMLIIEDEKNIEKKLNLVRNFDSTKDFYLIVELNQF